MKFSDACWTLPPIVLVIATISLAACASGGSEMPLNTCPPVASYPASLQAQAAHELAALPPGSAIEAMLVDYSVLRTQTRLCAE